MEINLNRRKFVKYNSNAVLLAKMVAIGFFSNNQVTASTWKKDWFSTITLNETMKVMGVKDVTQSDKIIISAPDTAENGAYVGVGVLTEIPEVEMIALLVENNPIMLAGYFKFSSKVMPNISTKVKMAESSNIISIIKTKNENYLMAKRPVNVTIGGCGS
ncbi:MAG: thiosulfate oxidation carrier protein SoxY [Betaproteobacteria bacterium TMED156]|nr:MAG: thiosulfate oxidation carrier protein SoxY [Betaproteobacteria bacterium TMED156]|tara:strand:- start:283 stop:762 length:480 start_codon:yes stop_codon:yes gene_type:complete